MVQIHVRAPVSASVPQQPQGEFRKLVWWPSAKTRCESDQGLQPSLSELRLGGPFYQGRDVTVSISACDADCAGANPVALTILDGPKLIVYPHHKEGVPSVAKALAVRVRFPAWSASARSRHLSI